MSRPLRIEVDYNRCVGMGMCLTLTAGVFRHNEQRQSEVVDPAGDSEDAVLEAAGNCPTSAIRVELAGTGEVLFP